MASHLIFREPEPHGRWCGASLWFQYCSATFLIEAWKKFEVCREITAES
jgi:hypothetical protein